MALRMLVLAVGPFGLAVGEALAEIPLADAIVVPFATAPDDRTLRRAVDHANAPAFAPIVLALTRPEPLAVSATDGLAFADGRSWVAIVLEAAQLRIGPYVVPGLTPCADCYETRLRQHDLAPAYTSALLSAYGRDGRLGPAGWPPGAAVVAAAVAVASLCGQRPGLNPGDVCILELLSLTTAQGSVTGVHGCSRCGDNTTEPDRSWKRLAADVVQLLVDGRR